MKKLYFLFFAAFILFANVKGQVAADYAVQLSVTIQQSPPQIMLQWKKLTGATGYTITRKGKGAVAWQSVASLTAADSIYTDVNVIADSAYEYQVAKSGGANSATGFIYAGIKAPVTHSRGALILLVDSTFRDSCKSEIAGLMNDLRGDGWAIIRHDIGRTALVTSVRNLIIADYQSRPNVTSLLLLGHIPVPYSGDLNPDGHPDHLGAWPTDAYYADIDGNWTDVSINDTLASRIQNRNKPGDGKWDQTLLPSNVELQTGRIDFANMPSFPKTEVQLMRSYLNKDHIYKMDSLAIIRKGLVDDNFGAFSGEAFAANAWRIFPTVVGANNIASLDFETTLKDSAYQWAYGCGGGSYTSAGGIGNSVDFATKPAKGIFTLLFGSYFGDWDAPDNFLRAPLCASEPALTCGWAGRPNWFLHHMGLGESIGYGTMLTQNNNFLYNPGNYGTHYVHIALMGDPSLRNNYIKPARNLAITPMPNAGATVMWTASPDPGVIGYYVYRSDTAFGTYSKISTLMTTTTFSDINGVNGKKFYQVRPVKLEQTPSGGYYNTGIGMIDSAIVSYPLSVATIERPQRVSLFPNPASNLLYAMVENTDRDTKADFILMNITGVIIMSDTKEIHAGQNTFSWNVSDLPSGVYALLVRTRDGTIVKKWIKMER